MSYKFRIRRFWFFWTTYRVVDHALRSSVRSYDSNSEAIEVPIEPWWQLDLASGDRVIIPRAQEREVEIIGQPPQPQGV